MEEIILKGSIKLGLKSCRHNMALLLGYSVDSHNVMSPPTGVGSSATGFCSRTECGECCSVRVRCRRLHSSLGTGVFTGGRLLVVIFC